MGVSPGETILRMNDCVCVCVQCVCMSGLWMGAGKSLRDGAGALGKSGRYDHLGRSTGI